MNTSSRVPGISRNSGWQIVDAELAARRVSQQQDQLSYGTAPGKRGSAFVQAWADLGSERV
jgi:hypothetical protein